MSKYYTKSGGFADIKVSSRIDKNNVGGILIVYKGKHDELWHYYAPDIVFGDILSVILYILKITSGEGTVFKVEPLETL